MASAVCTLFENHYYIGMAALVNSLYLQGFRGRIFAGYKGALEGWTKEAKNDTSLNWHNASSLKVADDLHIHFLPIKNEFHLANYKPFFIDELFQRFGEGIESVIYFDPDIVVKCDWSFFEEWITYGIAVVQEMTPNHMPSSHPIRKGWEKVIEKAGKKKFHTFDNYFNSGFCGIRSDKLDFIKTWQEIINIAVLHFGYKIDNFLGTPPLPYYFSNNDQDSFNIAAMCSSSSISAIGPEGMDFIPGGWIMSHAIGYPKPWKKEILLDSIKGYAPTKADKQFWTNVNGQILVFNNAFIRRKKICVAVASFIGRFYRRK